MGVLVYVDEMSENLFKAPVSFLRALFVTICSDYLVFNTHIFNA